MNTQFEAPHRVRCPRCPEWIIESKLADHNLWAHNVGGAVGVQYDRKETHA